MPPKSILTAVVFNVLAFFSFGQFNNQLLIGAHAIPDISDHYFIDLDKDGDKDLVCTYFNGYEQDKITWYEQMEKGRYRPRGYVTQNSDYNDVHSNQISGGDLDGDGNQDLLISYSDDKIKLFKNTANGKFLLTKTFNLPGASGITIGDIDGDGDLDILAASLNGSIVCYKNQGGGSFGASDLISSQYPGGDLVLSDIDKDGDLDFFTGNYELYLFLNNGNGVYAPGALISNPQFGVRNYSIADINNDNYPDIATAEGDGKINWYTNKKNGSFGAATLIKQITVSYLPAISVADFDGDGIVDLSYLYENSDITWLKNNGTGNFSGTPHIVPVTLQSKISGYSYLDAIDVDNDTDPELFSFHSGDGTIQSYENTASGNFALPFTVTGQDYSSVTTADLNNDGHLDVLSHNSWFPNRGDGTLDYQHVFSNRTAGLTYTADLDNDGDQDVLCGEDLQGVIWHYENTDNGNLVSKGYLLADVHIKSIRTNDIDSDGDLDLFTAAEDKISWYENLGSDNFSEERELSNHISGSANEILFVDMNNDGKSDLLIGWNSYIRWIPNLGNGSFGGELIFSDYPKGAFTLMLVDMDNDGKEDLLKTRIQDITWYRNTGPGTFEPEAPVATINVSGFKIDVKDLDGDGYPDIIVNDFMSDSLRWYPNTGNGNVGPARLIASAFAGQIHTADLDGDGDSEVFTSYLVNYSIPEESAILCVYTNKLYTFNGIPENTKEPISLYPNPFNYQLSIDVPAAMTELKQVRIYTIAGQQVALFDGLTPGKVKLDITNVQPGMYLVIGSDHNGNQLFQQKVLCIK